MNIRNFCILAHIDHGKSTLADRFLELTGTIEKRKMREQFLDMHPLEREKGITIKMQPVRMLWNSSSANYESNTNIRITNSYIHKFVQDSPFVDEYILNLIDTPGHADFSYEVSRALAAVEGAILLVDAAQGAQAQTLSNLGLAQKRGLTLLPAVNKIDLPSAETERTAQELAELLGVSSGEVCRISAKTGEGVEELLRAVVERIPPPAVSNQPAPYQTEGSGGETRELPAKRELPSAGLLVTSNSPPPLRALIFDSIFDSYQGVIAYVRVMEGEIRAGNKIAFLASGATGEALEVGHFLPERSSAEALLAGEIGYIATGVKEPEEVRVGDTVTNQLSVINNQILPLPGYREPKPVVFASVFPENEDEYEPLREALKKLKLNDAALFFEPEGSQGALGRGFRLGFLGMLHMEIVAERLKREYGIPLIFTHPSAAFRVRTKKGGGEIYYSAAKMPPGNEILEMEEPWVLIEIITPVEYLGAISVLVAGRGGLITATTTLGPGRLTVNCAMPLRELVTDFYDSLKSATQGYGSLSYELGEWKRGDLARLEILIAGEEVPALAEVVPREKLYEAGRDKVKRLKEILPRQLFSVAIQARAEGRILARETLPALKKDVTGYLYGGDRTRKMKLWAKQKKGKKRLGERGKIDIGPEVFLKILSRR